jgi:hypothetical protein
MRPVDPTNATPERARTVEADLLSQRGANQIKVKLKFQTQFTVWQI